MTETPDDFLTIRPRRIEPPAGAVSTPATPVAGTRSARGRWPVVALFAALLTALVWVFFVLPERLTTPVVAPAPTTTSEIAPPAGAPTTAPLATIEADRERRAVEGLLQRFVQLQIRLDDEMAVKSWAADGFAAAQRLANEGDERFLARRYAEASIRYQEGVAALEALVREGEGRFDAALARALEAIAREDFDGASLALDEAAVIHPKDPRIAAARQRIERAPQVAAARLRGDDAMARGAWNEAADSYAEALALDPAQTDLAALADSARARAADAAFEALLSSGYGALDGGDLVAAERAFRDALARRPGHRAASDGLAQVAQAGTLTQIERLQATARRQEAAEDWPAAGATYDAVLAVDGTLKFAIEGKARALERAALDTALEAALADPGRLADDTAFAETVALYDRAVRLGDTGPRLTAQLDRVERLLAVASEPVPVVFTSDGATEVSVFRVGPIGTFSTKTIELRPGRYVVTGSRKGCRDVRLEVTVAPAMVPVDVRCAETL